MTAWLVVAVVWLAWLGCVAWFIYAHRRWGWDEWDEDEDSGDTTP